MEVESLSSTLWSAWAVPDEWVSCSPLNIANIHAITSLCLDSGQLEYCHMKLHLWTYTDDNILAQNMYDNTQNFLELCLMSEDKKKKFLESCNDECHRAYQSILSIRDEFVDRSDADMILLQAHDYYQHWENTWYHHHDLIEYDKQLVYMYAHDDDRIFQIHNGVLMRTGGRRTEKSKNIFCLPYLVADWYQNHDPDPKLSVGYCGCPSNYTFKQDIVNELHQLDYTDFILRDKWANGSSDSSAADSRSIGPSPTSKKTFLTNMEDNLYNLCVRGTGNSSYRLYETLMMGRIPVFINTDCILPFESEIPWRKNTIFVTDFYDIDGQIRRWHDSHTPEELITISRENRLIWEKYFSVTGLYNNLTKLLCSIA